MEYKTIGELTTVVTGGTPSTAKPEYWVNGNIPWLQSGCCQNCEVNGTEKYITKLGYDNSSAQMMPKDSVMIALTGATAGKIGYLNFEACGNQSITGIFPCEFINQKFLFYYLISQRSKVLADCVGGAQAHISQGYVKKLKVPIYEKEKQNRIVEIFDLISNIIKAKEEEIKRYDNLIKARFVEMFGMPGTYISGRETVMLGDVCQINPKKTLDSRLEDTIDVSFVPMSAVSERGEIKPSEVKKYCEVKTGFTYFAENDVLFAKITPCMENGKGAVATGLCNGIGFGSTEFHVLRPLEGKTDPNWIYVLTSFPQFRKDAADNMTGSAGQRRVPSSFLNGYRISLPPLTLQKEFANFVQQVDKSKFRYFLLV